METTYKITQYDNGWAIEDSASLAQQVVQEKPSDKQHRKLRGVLGDWLYEDMNQFLEDIEGIECEIEIKFKKVEHGH